MMRRKKQRGGSALELALLLPWYVFLFVGAYDWGFYAHALISTEEAARTAALWGSIPGNAGNCTGAAILANEELRISSNVSATAPNCSNSVITVTSTSVASNASADKQTAANTVTVQYTTVNLIPIPGLLGGSATFYRTVQMPIRQ